MHLNQWKNVIVDLQISMYTSISLHKLRLRTVAAMNSIRFVRTGTQIQIHQDNIFQFHKITTKIWK